MDGDRQVDIVWRNYMTGENAIWYMDGTTHRSIVSLDDVTDLDWRLAGAGDFDNDGEQDLVWRKASTGENAVWLMNGTVAQSVVYLPNETDQDWHIGGTGDFNGDDKVDIYWRNHATGSNQVWLMDGTTFQSTAALADQPDLDWQMVGTQTAVVHPDLYGISFDVVEASADAGDSVTVEFNIENYGLADSPAFDVDVYLSTDGVIDTSDHKLGTVTIGSLAGGSTTGVISNSWQLPLAGTPFWQGDGTYTIGKIVDASAEVYEWDETNNDNQGGALDLESLTVNDTEAVPGDLDGDRQADILWRNESTGDNEAWLMNGTTIGSQAALDSETDLDWTLAGTGDFDRDGHQDILWRHQSTGQNEVWLMNGTARVSDVALLDLPDLAWQIGAVADMNGDRQVDIVWRNYVTGENAIWYMNGTSRQSFTNLLQVTDLDWWLAEAGDFDNDGDQDLLWRKESTGENAVWLMNGTVAESVVMLTDETDQDWHIGGTGDFNGDDKVDIYWRNQATGSNQVWLMDGTTYQSTAALSDQLNLDWQMVGTQQMVVPPDLYGIAFDVVEASLVGGGTVNVDFEIENGGGRTAGQFDVDVYLSTDGVIDTSDHKLGTVTVGSLAGGSTTGVVSNSWQLPLAGTPFWQGDGTYTIGMIVDVADAVYEWDETNNDNQGAALDLESLTINDTEAVPGDLDGDRQADILWRNESTGDNEVWLMNGTTTGSQEALNMVAGQDWTMGGMGDFNRDGHQDILWRDQSTGDNAVWLMNGTVRQSIVFLLNSSDLGWQIGAVADMNGDGRQVDIVWRNYVTGENAIWYMDGTAHQSTVNLLQVTDLDWRLAGAGDFDNDGDQDLLWRNESTGENEVWLMNGAIQESVVSLPNETDQDWHIGGTGDFNADDKVDIYWRNQATGSNQVWLMDGTTFQSTAALADQLNLDWQLVGTQQMVVHPDLYGISFDVVEASLVGGGTVNVDFEIENGGRRTAGQFDVDVYLSTDGVIDTSDHKLGTVTIGSLAGGSTTGVVSNSWQLPLAGTPFWQGDGTYTIGMIVDVASAVYEWDETNNDNQGAALDLESLTVNDTEAVRSDFNGDRQADILWRNESTGDNEVWLMNGTTTGSQEALNMVAGQDWTLGGMGDFNRDGHQDILWRDQSTGDNAVWLMNGTVRQSIVFLLNSSDLAWQIGRRGRHGWRPAG